MTHRRPSPQAPASAVSAASPGLAAEAEPTLSPAGSRKRRRAEALFWGIGAVILAAAVGLVSLDLTAPALPLWTATLLIMPGIAWFCLPALLGDLTGRQVFLGILAVGLAVRLIYLGSAPVLELDYFRYFWDGAAITNGLNPYAMPPGLAISGEAGPAWSALVVQSAGVAEQITYPHVSTIYPPVAQAVFVLAHWSDPWGLTGLRLLFLLCELAGVGLLVRALDAAGRERSWIALYWWNPLIAKEFINSAHMDALLVPFLAAILLALYAERRRLACLLIGLAAGVKLWPLLFVPLALLRTGWRDRLIGGGVLLALLMALSAPMILGRLDMQSGLVAYSAEWDRNDALFSALHGAIAWAADALGAFHFEPGRLARLAVALIVGLAAMIVALKPRHTAEDVARALVFITALLLLLSPTGYPWYYAWVLPFLCLVPIRGLLLLGVLMPIYYVRFFFSEGGDTTTFETWIVWIEFGPVLALLAYDFWKARGARNAA